jgi:type III restriction enzyme
VANRLDLPENSLLFNLHAVQERSGIPLDAVLQLLGGATGEDEDHAQAAFANFSVEMETGTGKTYVYIRTILELFERYGLRKFIIVVPSVAIREGVLKTLEITRPHFAALYHNAPYRYTVYSADRLSQIRQFALSSSIEIMIMTLDSFNKAANVIRQTNDHLNGDTPLKLVQATRPILILDEPQNMESERSIAALGSLNPLFALRYSATHRNPYNQVFRLTPFDAYRQGLVKRIEIASVVQDEVHNRPFIRIDGIHVRGRQISAAVAVHKLMKTGVIKEKVVTVRPGDNLQDKTDRPEYAGLSVEEINPGRNTLLLSDGYEMSVGDTVGSDRTALFAAQVGYTIEEHLRKQERLRAQGIKVLSLFFLDRVASYAPNAGVVWNLFVDQFEQLKLTYDSWRDVDVADVHRGYFAQSMRQGVTVLEDSTSGQAKKDEDAYDLIMKDKERLLSFDEPVAFIFSHSALREGWDNPNVFQICTLNQSVSQVRKRQEVGRGMRLAVNQEGERVLGESYNILTVVANESYERYVASLQSEIEADYGPSGAPPRPADARTRGIARLRKERFLSPEFEGLWAKIKNKTRYAVHIDSARLLDLVVRDIDALPLAPLQVTAVKGFVEATDGDRFRPVQVSGRKVLGTVMSDDGLPNLLDVMLHLLEFTTPSVALSRRTLVDMLLRCSNKAAMVANPQEFAYAAVRALKRRLADLLVEGIQYEKIDDLYEMTQFDSEIESWENYLVPASLAIYDQVVCDSAIERNFVDGLERRDDVRLFVKLPSWFTVPTPVGEYNPDWAIVLERRDTHGHPLDGKPVLYLVRETKSTTELAALRGDEQRKVVCGKSAFELTLGVSYEVVTDSMALREDFA